MNNKMEAGEKLFPVAVGKMAMPKPHNDYQHWIQHQALSMDITPQHVNNDSKKTPTH